LFFHLTSMVQPQLNLKQNNLFRPSSKEQLTFFIPFPI